MDDPSKNFSLGGAVQTVGMVNETPQKNTSTVFGVNADKMRHNFRPQRRRIAAKLESSRIKRITFHTFRHWKATMNVTKTKDILHVKEARGRKSINNTLLYAQPVTFKDDDFTARVARKEK